MNPMPKPTTPNTPLTRRALLHTGVGICATAAGAVLLSACSSSDDSLAKQANSGDNKGYIAGDGSVTEYQEAERGDPVAFTGELFDGKTVTAESLRGKPVLLNFWYAGCAPCRAEAPDLQNLSEEFKDKIAFYGVNVRDEKNTAEAFERSFNVTYPSFKDVTGKVLLSLSKYVPAQAVPTTVILDEKGRVASRVLGQANPSILKTLVETVTKGA